MSNRMSNRMMERMPELRVRRWATSLGLTLLLGAPLHALALQETRFLQAERYEVASGRELALRFGALSEGRLSGVAWPRELDAEGRDFEWAFVRAAGAQENLERFQPASEREDAVLRRLVEPGVTLIATDRRPFVESIPAGEWMAFLAANLGPEALPADWRTRIPEGVVRVRRRESSKLLVRVVGENGWLPNSATAQSKTGQAVELRPLADPTSVALKSDLPLRAYLPAARKDGNKVLAHHHESGRGQTFLTDAMGSGFFTVSVAGVWTVAAHAVRPLADDEGADWELASATLTFEVPAFDPRLSGKERGR